MYFAVLRLICLFVLWFVWFGVCLMWLICGFGLLRVLRWFDEVNVVVWFWFVLMSDEFGSSCLDLLVFLVWGFVAFGCWFLGRVGIIP